MTSQAPGIVTTYPPHTLQQTGPQYVRAPHQASNVFFESEIKKGSEIVISQSQQPLEHVAEIKQEEGVHTDQQQNVYYGSKDVSPELEASMYSRPAEITSTTVESSYTEVTQSSQVGSASSLMNLNPVHSSTYLSEGLPKPSQSDKTQICLTCGKAFRNKPQLTQHELVHNGVRKHICSYCEKGFKQICHLNQHIRVHTGERPYKCLIEGCGRSFAQLSNLNHHQKNHEEHVRRDVSRQFRCEVCERSYANQNSLQAHMVKLHTSRKEGETRVIGVTPRPKKKRKSAASAAVSQRYSLPAVSGEQGETYLVNLAQAEADGLPSQVRTKSSLDPKTTTLVPVLLEGKSEGCGLVGVPTQASMSGQYQNSPLSSLAEQYHNSPQTQKTHKGLGHLEPSISQAVSEQATSVEQVSSTVYTQSKPTPYQQQQLNLQSYQVPPREATPCSSGYSIPSREATPCSSGYSVPPREATPCSSSYSVPQREATPCSSSYSVPQREATPCSSGYSVPPREATATPISSDHPSLQMLQQQHQAMLLQQSGQGQGLGDRSSPLLTQQQPQRSSPMVQQQAAPSPICQQAQGSEGPSHVTHHYPEVDSQNKAGRPQLFNPAFSEHSGRYSQSQF